MSAPQVGWDRSDEDGWLIIDAIETAEDGTVVGYWTCDQHGGEHWFAADKIGTGWRDSGAIEARDA